VARGGYGTKAPPLAARPGRAASSSAANRTEQLLFRSGFFAVPWPQIVVVQSRNNFNKSEPPKVCQGMQ